MYLHMHIIYIRPENLASLGKQSILTVFVHLAERMKQIFASCSSTYIPNHESVYVNFSGGKLGKSYKNMKIPKCCKSSCTSSFFFK